jgi:hypothetical protein
MYIKHKFLSLFAGSFSQGIKAKLSLFINHFMKAYEGCGDRA